MESLDRWPWLHAAFNLLRSTAPPHGLLLTGSGGIGKGILARHWAKALLCEAGQEGPCGVCHACTWMAGGQHPDYRELLPIDAEGEKSSKAVRPIMVDQVRDLTDFLMVSAHRQGWKIILIEPADALNVAAANALLKSLEEPPPHTLFMLITDHPTRLPATLRSRCRHHAVPLPAASEALAWLRQEGMPEADEGCLRRAGGAPLRALEQQRLEKDGRRRLLDLMLSDAFSWLERVEGVLALDGYPWLLWLQHLVMDLVQCKLAGQGYYHADEQQRLTLLARRLALPDLLDWERRLREGQRWQGHPLNPRLVVESLLLPLHTTA